MKPTGNSARSKMETPSVILAASLLFSPSVWGKAEFFNLEELIENFEVVAIITLEEPETPGPFGDRTAGKDWSYAQKAKGSVETVLKGEIPDGFTLYGKENFHYAECHLSEGRYLAFLNKDGDLWVGANWQISLRPIRGGEVEWYIEPEAPFPMKFQILEAALAQIQAALKRKPSEARNHSKPKSKAVKDAPSESPFRRFLHDPEPSELEEWVFIIRYMERSHSQTPILIEVRANQTETRVRALRFFMGECEIDFIYTLDDPGNEILVPPDWALQLPEKGGSSGLDGIGIEFEVFTKEGTRNISRWSPERPSKEGGLESALRWAESWPSREEGFESAIRWAGSWLKLSGLVSRQNVYGQPLSPTERKTAPP